MINKHVYASVTIAAVLLISGCSAPKPPQYYAMPNPSQASALLKIDGLSNSGWLVERTDADCDEFGAPHNVKITYLADYVPKERYSNRKPTPTPFQEIALPAGLSSFFAQYSISDKSCVLNFDGLLIAGRKYEMQLEIVKRGAFKLDQCHPMIIDIETKAPIPIFNNEPEKLFMTTSCKRRNLLQNLDMPAAAPMPE